MSQSLYWSDTVETTSLANRQTNCDCSGQHWTSSGTNLKAAWRLKNALQLKTLSITLNSTLLIITQKSTLLIISLHSTLLIITQNSTLLIISLHSRLLIITQNSTLLNITLNSTLMIITQNSTLTYLLTYLLHGAGSFLSSWLACS